MKPSDIEDDELRGLVQQLLSLANAEAYVRGAMLCDGPGTKKRREALVHKAVRLVADVQADLPAEPERRGLLERCEGSLRAFLRGLSRTANLGRALEVLVGARRMTRVRVDARGAEVEVVVPPVSICAKGAGQLEAVLDEAAEIVDAPGGLDAFDRALAFQRPGRQVRPTET